MSNIKKNFAYSSVITGANYIFPLLTFPYISRVLGVTGIGIYNYVDSVINYVLLFTMLGINTVGIRVIAASKNNSKELSGAFSSLILFNLITTIIGILILAFIVYTIPKFYEYKGYFFIGIFKILATCLLAEWFYKGMEDFKYITKRSLIVKTIYVLSIFFFIQKDTDTKLYYFLTTMMLVVNATINIVHIRKFINISFTKVNFKAYIKPMFVYGCYIILTSMYTSFNVTYLGFMADVTQVGFYTTATKLHTIIISIFTAFTGVMLPRMTNLLSQNKNVEFVNYIKKSQLILVAFSIPAMLFCIIFASDIIFVIAGNGFQGAIIPMTLIMPLIFIIGYEQILVIQILNPLKKDTIILRNSIIGACVGLFLNVLLVPYLKAIGSSIVWIFTETLILIIAQYYVTKFIHIKFPYKKIGKTLLYYLPLCVFFIFIKQNLDMHPLIRLIIMSVILIIYTTYIEIKLKNEILLSTINKICYRWKRKYQ